MWDVLWPLLAQARTEENVTNAFDEGASPYTKQFAFQPWQKSSLMLGGSGDSLSDDSRESISWRTL